jgi:hypothetical protein
MCAGYDGGPSEGLKDGEVYKLLPLKHVSVKNFIIQNVDQQQVIDRNTEAWAGSKRVAGITSHNGLILLRLNLTYVSLQGSFY